MYTYGIDNFDLMYFFEIERLEYYSSDKANVSITYDKPENKAQTKTNWQTHTRLQKKLKKKNLSSQTNLLPLTLKKK